MAQTVVACTRTSLPANPGQRTCQKGPPRAMPPRLLTRVEYDNTVRDLLGDTTQPAQAQLPKEPLAFGWENNADLYQPTPKLVAALTDLAEDVATRALVDCLFPGFPFRVVAGERPHIALKPDPAAALESPRRPSGYPVPSQRS